MSVQIHGHEVMEMMATDGKTYTKETLREAMATKFGSDARFFTCSAENMTADELIVFLEMRGKFIPSAEGFSTDKSKICSHDAHHR